MAFFTAITAITAPAVFADSDPYPASYNWTPDPVPTVPVATVSNNVTFSIQLSNSGPSASPAGVGGTVATIAVPPGIRVTNDGGAGTNYPNYCTLSGAYPAAQQLVCQVGSLPVGANVLTIVYAGTALDVGSGTAATAVAVSQSDTDPNPGNETLNRTVTLQTGADLQIGLSASAASLPAGALLTYTLSPSNAGPGNSNAMRVTMNLPPAGDFSPCQNISSPACPTAISGTNWSCGVSGAVLTCNWTGASTAGSLPAISVPGRIVKSIVGTISANATIASTSTLIPDGLSGNNTTSNVVVTITAGTDLAAGIDVTPAPIATSQAATIALTITNNGPQSVTGATITSVIPGAFTGVVAPSGCVYTIGTSTMVCTGNAIASGGSQTFNITTTAAGSASTGTISSTVAPPGGVVDSIASNDTASFNYTISAPRSDLSMQGKSKSPNPISAGNTITSTISVRNGGFSIAAYDAANPIRVTDQFGANERFTGVSSGWTCLPAAPVDGPVTVTCSTSNAGEQTLAVNGTLTVQLTSQAIGALSPPPTLTNTACTGSTAGSAHRAKVGTSYFVNNDSNATGECNGASVVATDKVVDTSIVKEVGPDGTTWQTTSYTVPAIGGTSGSVYFRLTATNSGPDTAPSIAVRDILPIYINQTYFGTTHTTGVSIVSSTAGSSCSISGATVSCTWTNVSGTPGSNTREVIIKVDRPMLSITSSNATGAYTNTAYVCSTDSTESVGTCTFPYGDPSSITGTGNNASSVALIVEPQFDLEVDSKTVLPNPAQVGVQANYTISYRNKGPNSTRDPGVGLNRVIVQDPIDAAKLTYIPASVSATKSGANCSATTVNQAECDVGQIHAGEVFQMSFGVRSIYPYPGTPPYNGTYTNIASIPTLTGETNAGNNSFTLVHAISPPRFDLVVLKQEAPSSPEPIAFGTAVTYRVTMRNDGPSRATQVRLLDLPNTGGANTAGYSLVYTGFAVVTAPSGRSPTCANNTPAAGQVSCYANASLVDASNYLDSGESFVVDLSFNITGIAPTTAKVVFNQATVSSQETRDDPGNTLGYEISTANNGVIDNTTAVPVVDFQLIAKTTLTASPVNINQPVRFRIQARNLGTDGADRMRIEDTLPSGWTYIPGTGTINSGLTTYTGVLLQSCTQSGAVLTCDILGTFTASATDTVTLEFDAKAQFPTSGATGTGYANTIGVVTNNVTVKPGKCIKTAPDGSSSLIDCARDGNASNNNGSSTVTVQKSSLSGRVYADHNRNDAIDAGEGLNNITLTLSGTDAWNNAISATTTTDSNGNFSFQNLPPAVDLVNGTTTGSYTITESHPTNYFDRNETAGTGCGGASCGTVDNASYTTAAAQNRVTAIDLRPASDGINYTFQELERIQVSGFVYHDANNNGQRGAGETTGHSGIQIRITGTDYVGNAVLLNVNTTGATGTYSFTQVPPPAVGTNYTISEQSQPASTLDGKEENGAGVVVAASENRVAPEGMTLAYATLQPGTAGVNLTNRNFGELVPASITGFVFIDTNGNATKDVSETAGLSGVTVTLTGTDDLGSVNTSTTTSGSGAYTFSNLRPGTYVVTETNPTGTFVHTGAYSGSLGGTILGVARAANTAVLGATANTITAIPIASGNAATAYNFGEQGQGLAGFVYSDNNSNNTRDAGDTGIAGVTIELRKQSDNSLVTTATTDTTGAYSFSNLPADTYKLIELQPAGYSDRGEQIGTLGGTNSVNDQIQSIGILVGQFGTGYNFAEAGTTLSGKVYIDTNTNNTFDTGEPAIGSVTITLSGTVQGTGTNICSVIATCVATTDVGGAYTYTGLPLGTYTITETQPAAYADGIANPGSAGGVAAANQIQTITLGAPGSTNNNFGERAGSLSGYVYRDTNNDGVRNAPGEAGLQGVTVQVRQGVTVIGTVTTDSTGKYIVQNLPAGTYDVFETTEPANSLDGKDTAGQVNAVATGTAGGAGTSQITSIAVVAGGVGTEYNFGELLASSIAGTVYVDVNNNGSPDTGEGVPNVTITLTGNDDLGVAVNRVVTTDASGNYLISNLRPSAVGGYIITETQPAGLNDRDTQLGTVGGVAGVNQFTGVVLNSGVTATGYRFREIGASLAGSVYLDASNNGQRDLGENGIAGVTVTLSGGGLASPRVATTDSSGNYLFAGLVAGTYVLTETQPALFADGLDRVGTAGGTLGNDTITAIGLGTAVTATGYDFGERPALPATIAGAVWLNTVVRDQIRQPGEPGLPGWTVELVRAGAVVTTATTDSNGAYTFTNLVANTGYEIRFRNPISGAIFGPPISVEPGVDLTQGTIRNLTVGSGANIVNQSLPIDPSGVVYNSITRVPVNGASVRIDGPPGFDAATHLVGGAGNQVQVVGSDGFYQYFLLPTAPAGTYSLTVTPPAGYVPGPSATIPPTAGPFNVPGAPNPYAIVPSSTAPTVGQPTTYYLSFVLSGASANVINNHIPIDPILGGAIVITKTTPLVNVARGDLVPYTIIATNTLAAMLANIDVRDVMPPGFRYRLGSATLNGVPLVPLVNGRELTWRNLSFAPNERKTFKLILAVGTGVADGQYVNTAFALNNTISATVSNIATATVRITPDPSFDCSDIIGKVFDDRNANGYQDEGEPGVPSVRVATARGLLVTTDAEGRFHVACAAIPNADRGANFVMKLDERSLPSGYRITTENPRVVRVTRGTVTKLNFGVTVHRVVRIDLDARAFDADTDHLLDKWREEIRALPARINTKPHVVRIAYQIGSESKDAQDAQDRAKQRIEAVSTLLRREWERLNCCYLLTIEHEIHGGRP